MSGVKSAYLTSEDLRLVVNLSGRKYQNNTLGSNASEQEWEKLRNLKPRLKSIAQVMSEQYDQYGPFEVSRSTGNDIKIGGTQFGRIWSAMSKGGQNKQYSAQISFVADSKEPNLNVGFYFGRASSHDIKRDQHVEMIARLRGLGRLLVQRIAESDSLRRAYQALFDFGFKAYKDDQELSPEAWLQATSKDAIHSEISFKLFPNNFGIVDIKSIDEVVSQLVFLMEILDATAKPSATCKADYIARAKRSAEIGLDGELFIVRQEEVRLRAMGIADKSYPRHVSLESDHYGYDIVTLDKNLDERFIEVKTTTRRVDDPKACEFFLTLNEKRAWDANIGKYELVRVFDIDGVPSQRIIPLDTLVFEPSGLLCRFGHEKGA